MAIFAIHDVILNTCLTAVKQDEELFRQNGTVNSAGDRNLRVNMPLYEGLSFSSEKTPVIIEVGAAFTK